MIEESKLPKGWTLNKLGNVCDVLDNLRKPINSTERKVRILGKDKKDLFPYYGATGQVGWIDGFMTDGDYILVGEDGAPFLDLFKDKAYKISGKTWVNNHAHILKGKKGIALDSFVLFYLNSINYREFVNGTTRLKLTKSSLVEIPFVVPPPLEQQKIVTKIEELFSQLENGKQQLLTAQKQLKTYRQSLLKSAFEGKLTNQNLKAGELPKNWEIKKLGDLLKTVDGDRGSNYPKKNEFFKDGYCLFLSTKNVRVDKFLFDEKSFVTKEKDEKLRGGKLELGDIVITTRGTLGNVALYDEKIPFKNIRINSGMLLLRIIKKDLSNYYLMKFITSPNFILQLKNKQSGTAQPQIPANVLREIEITFPPLEEQEKIIAILESKLTICDKIEETIKTSLQQSETLRQSILKKAFEGRLV
jgi:type I restriction enzyme S subunit